MELQSVILSGGSGTRLGPLSREQYPKQLLAPLFDSFHRQFPRTRIIVESGRFVAGKCGALLVTVTVLALVVPLAAILFTRLAGLRSA